MKQQTDLTLDAWRHLRFAPKCYAVLLLSLVPWFLTVLATAGVAGALNLFGYVLLAVCSGYAVIAAAVPSRLRPQAIPFAPALGILLLSSLTAIILRLGYSLTSASLIWLVLVIPGVYSVFKDRTLWMTSSIDWGASVALLSVLVCALYFVPTARKDAVLRKDGSFNWIYVDTQFFNAIAADIAGDNRPPRTPGAFSVPLEYHFAPYTPAAVISHTTGLALNDAFARVTRGASIWALLLAAFGLGCILSVRFTGSTFGGMLGTVAFFFYGSMLSLFTDVYNSSGFVTGPVLFKIPEVDVLADGGPFSHIILGHSALHGLLAITSVLGICLTYAEFDNPPSVSFRSLIPVLLPALVAPFNSVAALYCLTCVIAICLWSRLTSPPSWIITGAALILFVVAWRVMGYGQAPDVHAHVVDRHPWQLWWTLTVEFTIGLGIRLIGFRWISARKSNSMRLVVAVGSCVFLAFFLALDLDGNERYGIYFLQAMMSIFAFSTISPDFWSAENRIELARFLLKIGTVVLGISGIAGIVIVAFAFKFHQPTNIPFFKIKVVIVLAAFAAAAGLYLVIRRSVRPSAFAAALMLVLGLGFSGWITPWLNYAMGRARRDVILSSGEVSGLRKINDATAPRTLMATNKHAVDSLVSRIDRSYAYSTLSLRPVLLEGYMDHGIEQLPVFSQLLRDNDEMFTTTDQSRLRVLTDEYKVNLLVARPGTDISVSPLPGWLERLPDTGSLRVYKVSP